MTNDLIPISDAQAKAIEEALKALQGVGGFLKETFGTVPQDIVGLLGGDFLKVKRALLAAAADPKQSSSFRLRFIEVVKAFDPTDPIVLKRAAQQTPPVNTQPLREFASTFSFREDLVAVSLANLERLDLMRRISSTEESQNYKYLLVTPLGRELLRAVGEVV